MKQGKKIRNAVASVDRDRMYALVEGIKVIKNTAEESARKFVETMEVSIALGIDTRQSDQAVRGMVQLPNGTGKTVKVAVFARGDKADAAKEAGADIVGAEELAEKIQGGFSDFDRVVASPDMMAVVGRLGKILGPRGLMPNPKLGTVTPNVADAVKAAKAGSIEFRAEKNGIIHAGIGKVNFTEAELIENVRALLTALTKARPSNTKGSYIQRVNLSSTMGPGIKVDLGSLAEDA